MENAFKPRCCGIWSVLSKEQLNFANIINEFIDNARAAAATRITVHLVQTDTDEFSLEVTDDGYGMAREDFDQIFSVGALQGALAYKRCGMGLKVALANADPENLSWEIRTKTTNGECSYIGAPYAEQMAFESLSPKEMKRLRRSGTIISSMLSRSVFERGLEGTESDEERIVICKSKFLLEVEFNLTNSSVIHLWKLILQTGNCFCVHTTIGYSTIL